MREPVSDVITRRALLGAAASAVVSARTLGGSRVARAEAPENIAPLLEPIRSLHGMPAVAAAYVRGAGLRALGAVGNRWRNDPVEASDRFHLGSCTKSMTATAIARLVEEGRIGWSATIGDIFPDLRDTIHRGYRTVTLIQLLSHRAGLAVDRNLWSEMRGLTGSLPEQRRKLVGFGLKQSPGSEPGSRMEYSNFGYITAGAMAEQVTGQAWEDLMRRLVFGPLGMTTAGFGAPGRGQPSGHTADGCKPVSYLGDADNPPVLGPAGTVHSTLGDWAAYASQHLLGAQSQSGLLLKPASFADSTGITSATVMRSGGASSIATGRAGGR